MSFWTNEELSYINSAPFPAEKDEILDYGMREGWPKYLLQNLNEELEDGVEYGSDYFIGDANEDPDFDDDDDDY